MHAPQGGSRARLLEKLYAIISDAPGGIKEYDLYLRLKEAGIAPFCDSDLSDELVLYRIHFLLFHLLYTLQDRLRESGAEDLEIHCLDIRLKPWRQRNQDSPAVIDPLKSYYMEVERLETVQRHEARQMIDDFWRQLHNLEDRAAALTILGLADPVENAEIKKRYRLEAKKHHPDRGGDAARFREITAAAELLLP